MLSPSGTQVGEAIEAGRIEYIHDVPIGYTNARNSKPLRFSSTGATVSEPVANMFEGCIIRFVLEQGECFSILPKLYLKFDEEDTPTSTLLSATFELNTDNFSQQYGDHIYLKSFVALRDYLRNILAAPISDTLEFKSEEGVVAITFTRQNTTLRISGRIPNDGYFEDMYSDSQAMLEKRFTHQIVFYCNFPLENVPKVADEMSHVLQVIENAKE